MLQHAAAAPPMTPAQKPEQEATSKLSEPPAQPTEQNKPDASMDESTNVQLVEGEWKKEILVHEACKGVEDKNTLSDLCAYQELIKTIQVEDS